MFASIWSALETIVATVIPLSYWYWRKLATAWYPYATVTPMDTTETVQSSSTNMTELWYQVELFYKNNWDDWSATELAIRTAVDALMTLFRANYTLWWLALNTQRSIEWWYSADAEPVRIAVIKCIYSVCNPI